MSYISELNDKYILEEFEIYPNITESVLRLEVTNICNHRCIFCPHVLQKRKPAHIDDKLAKRIILEAAKLGVKKVALFLNGEPFLNKNLIEYISFCKKNNYEFVFVTTNGTAEPEEYFKAMEAGLDSLKFSINGTSRENYKRVHGCDQYDRVLDTLVKVKKYRDQHELECRLLTGCVVTTYVENELETHLKKMRTLTDDLAFLEIDNFAGYMIEEKKKYGVKIPENIPGYSFPEKKLPCSLINNSINVTSEGFLTLCCSEALNMMVVEDLNKISLQEAWFSERMTKIRSEHKKKQLSNIQCKRCIENIPYVCSPINDELYLKSVQR